MERLDFLTKLANGPETYLLNSYEDAGIKITIKNGTWVKFPGKEEFKAQEGSEVVADAILEQKIISKAEYEKI